MVETITRDSEEFKKLTRWVRGCKGVLENITARVHSSITDGHYLAGEEVYKEPHVSGGMLQTLKDEKAVPHTSITTAEGKLLYPKDELYEMLRKGYKDFR